LKNRRTGKQPIHFPGSEWKYTWWMQIHLWKNDANPGITTVLFHIRTSEHFQGQFPLSQNISTISDSFWIWLPR